MSSKEHGTTSFMDPELLLLPGKFGLYKEFPSKEADIYTLGMTVYQVLTGKQPFFPRRIEDVIHVVISGEPGECGGDRDDGDCMGPRERLLEGG